MKQPVSDGRKMEKARSPEINPLTAAQCSAMPKHLCTKITTNVK